MLRAAIISYLLATACSFVLAVDTEEDPQTRQINHADAHAPNQRGVPKGDFGDAEGMKQLKYVGNSGRRSLMRRQLEQLEQLTPPPPPYPTPPPPSDDYYTPYNPFEEPAGAPEASPFKNSTDMLCCCRSSGGAIYEQTYVDPAPANCCCGTRSACCSRSGLVNVICGGGHVCGILMLLSALMAVLVLTVCVTGTFLSRRRRRQALAMQAATTANGTAPGPYPAAAQMLEISNEQLEVLRVRSPSEADPAGAKECPICLETVTDTSADTWAIFPCAHGCCKPCLRDLLHHSSRRVNSTTLAVLCPLCRKLAVATGEGLGATGRTGGPRASSSSLEVENQVNAQAIQQPNAVNTNNTSNNPWISLRQRWM